MRSAGLTSLHRIVSVLLPVVLFAVTLAGFAQINVASAASGASSGNQHFPLRQSIAPHVFKTRQAHSTPGIPQSASSRTSGDALIYNGGPVMQSGTIDYAIFWEPPKLQDGMTTSVSAHYNSLLQQYFGDIGGSALYNVASQYYDNRSGHIVNSATFGGAWVDTTSYPASGCIDSATPAGCLTDVQIQAEVTRAMNVNSWTSGLNHIFFVFTSDGEGSCFDSTGGMCSFTYYCAYHSAFEDSNNHPVIYANMPYTGTVLSACGVGNSPNNDPAADSTINVTSHEQMEAVTDPLLNAWYDTQGNEIGDKCAWNFGSVNLDGGQANEHWHQDYYLVQQEWSNALDGCSQGEQGDQLAGTLYTGAKDGTLYATSTSDGSPRWHYQIPTHKSITTSPLVSNDVVYFGSSDSYIYAVNATSGAFLWRTKTGAPVESTPAIAGGVLYAGSDDGSLYALNSSNGSLLWKYQTRGRVTAPPVAASNVVYIGSGDGTLYALNAGSGNLLWRYATHEPISGPAIVTSSAVYIGSNDGSLFALNSSTGNLLWQYRLGSAINGAFAASNGVLYAGAMNGTLYALALSNHTLLWKYAAGSAIQSAPTIANNAIYFAASNGTLDALTLSTHALLWKYRASGGISGSPSAIDVAIYTQTPTGTLYALGAAHGNQLWNTHDGSAWLSPAVETAGVLMG